MANIALFGKNEIAVNCLEILLQQGHDLKLIVVPSEDNGKNTWTKSLRKVAEQHGLHTVSITNCNDPDFVQEIKDLDIEYLISIQYWQILKKNIINAPKSSCLNLHFSLLPKNRGTSPVAWAILKGESFSGVTLHQIDEGIDTGPIYCQQKLKIETDDTARDLYDKLVAAGTNLIKKNFPKLVNGKITPIKQDHSKSSIQTKSSLDFTNKYVDWSKPGDYLFNWIRAFIFPPFQYPVIKKGSKEIEIVKASFHKGLKNQGTPIANVMSYSGDSVILAVIGGGLELKHIILDGKEIHPREVF